MEKAWIIFGKNKNVTKFKILEKTTYGLDDKYITRIEIKSNKDFQNPFLFNECTPETQLIIFTGKIESEDLIQFYKYIPDGFPVNKKYEEPFIIEPELIILCDSPIESIITDLQIPSFSRRFEILALL